VTVVTVEHEPGKIHGMTANSFTSVSLDPLLILVWPSITARNSPSPPEEKTVRRQRPQDRTAGCLEYFARGVHSAEAEERLSIRYSRTASGLPVLEDTLLQLSCSTVARISPGITRFLSRKSTMRRSTRESRCSIFAANTATSPVTADQSQYAPQ